MATAAQRKRKSRALQPKAKRAEERTANRERNRKKRETGRIKPVTEEDFLKEAARVGPARDGPLKKVRTGAKIRTGQRVSRIDVAEWDEHSFGGYSGRRRRKSLAELSPDDEYNRANIGPPWWWMDAYVAWRKDDQMPWHESKPRYTDAERRWVRYMYGFGQRKDGPDVGRRLEERGLGIAATLQGEARDVQWVAAWVRDGHEYVPRRAAEHGFTALRMETAIRRLKELGLVVWKGRWLIE